MTALRADGAELVADGLACRRGERLIFRGLSCVLLPGAALVLTGPNGSGKSSLLRLFATLLTPAAGRLTWGGSPITDDLAAYRAGIRYVGHLDAIKPALTVRENLAFWAMAQGIVEPLIDGALAALGIDAIADWPSRFLSAGQRRRLALAKLAASPAWLWLLDEPTASLDADGEACLTAALEAHRASSGRVVVATHQPLALAGAQNLALEDFAAARDVPAGDPLDDF